MSDSMRYLNRGGAMPNQESISELIAIKKLLILQLVRSGVSTNSIGKALGVTGQRIRQLVPGNKAE